MSTKKRKKPNPEKPVIAKKGLVMCYIGDGKGKTTAGMGAAVRAAGAGMNVFVLQFVKAQKPKDGERLQPGEWPLSSEINFFNHLSQHYSIFGGESSKLGIIETDQVGAGFVGILGDKKGKDQHIREALRGLEIARQIIISGKYQVVIFDELLSALDLKLIEERDVLDLISIKPEMMHLVMTGHSKHPKIFKHCDVVTEMKMMKHPYYEGVLAQKGIDY